MVQIPPCQKFYPTIINLYIYNKNKQLIFLLMNEIKYIYAKFQSNKQEVVSLFTTNGVTSKMIEISFHNKWFDKDFFLCVCVELA